MPFDELGEIRTSISSCASPGRVCCPKHCVACRCGCRLQGEATLKGGKAVEYLDISVRDNQ
jgi:hypothetical protein